MTHMPCRSVRPIMVEQFNIDWEKIFSFLFPDGNILHGSWASYAIIAFVLAVFIELGTQLLYLLVRVSTCMQATGAHRTVLPICALQNLINDWILLSCGNSRIFARYTKACTPHCIEPCSILDLLCQGRELISPRRAEAMAKRQAIESMKTQRKEQMEERARQLAVEQRAQQIKAQRKQQQRSGNLERQGTPFSIREHGILCVPYVIDAQREFVPSMPNYFPLLQQGAPCYCSSPWHQARESEQRTC